MHKPPGTVVRDWQSPPRPGRVAMEGRLCRLEPLHTSHIDGLYEVYGLDAEGGIWTYLPYGPFDSLASFRDWAEGTCFGDDPLFYAIVDPASGKPLGVASYLRIDPRNGSIEVGHINYSPQLQRTRAATEAMYLMMARAFELGYRRYEWKCNALNAPSRAAARRLGFSFEGVMRQATVVKGRNRDTAWFSVIDGEWPALKDAFENWLSPGNFDAQGRQRTRLSDLTAPILNQRIVETDP